MSIYFYIFLYIFLIMSIYFYIFLYCVVFATDFCSHFLLVDTDPRSSLQQQGIETKKASQTESCRKSQVIGRAMWCAENISTDGSAKFENENSRNMSNIWWENDPNRGHYSEPLQHVLSKKNWTQNLSLRNVPSQVWVLEDLADALTALWYFVMSLSSWSCHWVIGCMKLDALLKLQENSWLQRYGTRNISSHTWLLDGVSPESFELQWPASTAMIGVLKLHQTCPAKQEMKNREESHESRDESRESAPERSSRPSAWVSKR